MPHIEVIPIASGTAPAPGWAYVPDTGYDPSKVAINPTGRKRNARHDAGSAHDLSARQQTQLHKRLAELDRDNQKDVALSAKAREGGATPRERAGHKMTPAVRKILQSGRTFAHWLADEEALSAQRPGALAGAGQTSSAAQTAAASPAPSSSAAGPSAQSRSSKKTTASRAKRGGSTAVSSSGPATPSAQAALSASNTAAPSPAAQPAISVDIELPDAPPSEDEDPLLRPVVPEPLSAQEIQTLLAHPPLPYGAAKSAPPNPDGPPPRQFCEICGYWGRIKCLKCAARVCGLDCKRAHDETSCLRM